MLVKETYTYLNDRKKGARLKRGHEDVLRQVRPRERDLYIFVKETYTHLNDRKKGARLKRG